MKVKAQPEPVKKEETGWGTVRAPRAPGNRTAAQLQNVRPGFELYDPGYFMLSPGLGLLICKPGVIHPMGLWRLRNPVCTVTGSELGKLGPG